MRFQSETCVFKFLRHSVDNVPNVLDKNVNIALPLDRGNLSYQGIFISSILFILFVFHIE